MKKSIKRGFSLLLTTALLLSLISCGGQPEGDGDKTPESTKPAVSGNKGDVADLNDGVTKIALLISGDLGDMSFWDSANAGMIQFEIGRAHV